MKRKPVGRGPDLDQSISWFSDRIENARRQQEEDFAKEGLDPSALSQNYFLERLHDRFGALATACNESTSRKEVIEEAAVMADLCRRIAEIERPAPGQTDSRWETSDLELPPEEEY